MLLRPAPARWFELLVVRDELPRVLRALAATGQVELQGPTGSASAPLATESLLPALRAAVDQYRRLAERYAPYWPAPDEASHTPHDLDEVPRSAVERLQAWAKDADPLIARLQQLAGERSDLERLRGLISAPGRTLPSLTLFGSAGPVLASRAYLLAPETGPLAVPTTALAERISAANGDYLLALGSARDVKELDETLGAEKARRLAIAAKWPASLAALDERLAEIDGESREAGSALARSSQAHAVGSALADLHFIEWLLAHLPELAMTPRLASITGWTTASGAELRTALENNGLDHLLRFIEAPEGVTPPVVLHNPRWVRPFELFARLLGVPGATEADPSLILAVLAPLMFGFMFGDVGQGAMLLAAGLALRKRYPSLALLVPGGASAMAFGLLFGSVFAREDVLRPLWLRPLAQPITLLLVSLVYGAGILLLGLALDALQYFWAARARAWWSTRAGIVVCYAGVIGSVVDIRTLWALPAGLGWCAIGAAAQPQASAARLKAAGASVGAALETLLQLLINTLSFVRIGAFALAHAGLASAITGLAAATGSRPMFWLVMAFGNAFVLSMEGLVVAIQTTRLVLFEFFVRFLHGSGRPFHPLPLPEGASSTPPRPRSQP